MDDDYLSRITNTIASEKKNPSINLESGGIVIIDAKNHLGLIHKLYLLHMRESQSMASISRSNNALQRGKGREDGANLFPSDFFLIRCTKKRKNEWMAIVLFLLQEETEICNS